MSCGAQISGNLTNCPKSFVQDFSTTLRRLVNKRFNLLFRENIGLTIKHLIGWFFVLVLSKSVGGAVA